jgi:hypothetical protein
MNINIVIIGGMVIVAAIHIFVSNNIPSVSYPEEEGLGGKVKRRLWQILAIVLGFIGYGWFCSGKMLM